MWILKLKLMHKDCHIVPRCEKFKVNSYAYPTSNYTKKGRKYATAIHFLEGEEKNKKAFLRDLKKDRRIKKLEISGSIYSYEVDLGKAGEHVQLYHGPEMAFVAPVINSRDGFEYWNVAAYDKNILMKFVKSLKKHMDYFEMLKFQDEKLKDIYFPNVLPELSLNQRKAIILAYQMGYYTYPRKTDLRVLAKEAKISVATFQEHLRKAEIKLLPFIIREMKS